MLTIFWSFSARFLEFDMLAQLSEDIIIDSLTVEILPSVLKWANCPHGSAFVRRQAMLFLREEFVHLINAPSFLDLSRSTLVELVQSDFLQVGDIGCEIRFSLFGNEQLIYYFFYVTQASEVDVLNAIVRWGESQLIKRVEDRGKYIFRRLVSELQSEFKIHIVLFFHSRTKSVDDYEGFCDSEGNKAS